MINPCINAYIDCKLPFGVIGNTGYLVTLHSLTVCTPPHHTCMHLYAQGVIMAMLTLSCINQQQSILSVEARLIGWMPKFEHEWPGCSPHPKLEHHSAAQKLPCDQFSILIGWLASWNQISPVFLYILKTILLEPWFSNILVRSASDASLLKRRNIHICNYKFTIIITVTITKDYSTEADLVWLRVKLQRINNYICDCYRKILVPTLTNRIPNWITV